MHIPDGYLSPESCAVARAVGLITDLHAAGKTILCATHDLDLLRALADRCIVMTEDHRIAAAGAPDLVLGDRALLRRVNLIAEEGCA